MAVTITDVARAAGVSASTVSRALSRPERVDAATRTAILHQVARLGYQPNRAARSLITGRTGNVGVIVPDLANPFFPDVVKAVQVCAHRSNLTTLLADSGEDPAAEFELIHQLAPQVDGIVLCGSALRSAELATVAALVPLVLINRDAPGITSVLADNAGGAGQAVRHLRALGHRRVGYVGGPIGSRSNHLRLLGAQAGAQEHGVELVELGCFRPSFEGGMAAADSVLLAQVPAVLAYNDVIAIGLMHRLAAYGVAVPGDVSVVGFDDVALAAMAFPALTTVRFPRAESGRLAVERLLALIAGTADGSAGSEQLLPTELVVRRSTGRAPATPPGPTSSAPEVNGPKTTGPDATEPDPAPSPDS